MADNITIEQLATELGVKWREVANCVTPLCQELGPRNVVAEAKGMTDSVLTGNAADIIREQLAEIAR
jgi:hypothetical protein